MGYRLQGPCCLNRHEHNPKIRARKQRRDITKFSFVNMIIKLWDQVTAEALAILPSKSSIFLKKGLVK
jgi:hypothetical protein